VTEIKSKLQGMFTDYIVHLIGKGILSFETRRDGERRIANDEAAGLSMIIVGMLGASPVDSRSGLSCDVPKCIWFNRLDEKCMRPADAGQKCAHLSMARVQYRSCLQSVGDDPARRVEVIVVDA